MPRRLTAVDIYCGCGGMSIGAAMGVPALAVRYGLDNDKYACDTFKYNHPDAHVDCQDVAKVSAHQILDRAGVDHIDYLLTGPTCQAVSTMGLFYTADSRNLLFVHLARILSDLKRLGKLPRNVVLENVPGIVYQKNLTLVRDLLRFFDELGYKVGADVLNVAMLGVPQLRYRFFLLATLEDKPISFPEPEFGDPAVAPQLNPYRSVAEAISDLYELAPQDADEPVPYSGKASTAYQRMLRGQQRRVANHWASNTQKVNLERISAIPQGGSWKDIPADLLPARFHRVRMTDYHTLYGRLHEANPAYTISAEFGNVTAGCFTHPRQSRALTVREGCRIQGFPDEFRILGPKNAQYRQVGNAVPPLAMAALMAFWERSPKRAAGRAPRITLSVLRDGARLPVMTPRFQSRQSDQTNGRTGYGSGTFWPKGWGTVPSRLPKNLENYRKVTDPLIYRRTSWREQQEIEQESYFSLVRGLNPSEVVAALEDSAHWLVQPIRGAARAVEAENASTEAFYRILAPLAAVLIKLGDKTLVVADFGYTADRLAMFLRRFALKAKVPLRVERLTADHIQRELFSNSRDHEVCFVARTESYLSGSATGVFSEYDRVLHFSPFVSVAAELAAVRTWCGLRFGRISKARSQGLCREPPGAEYGLASAARGSLRYEKCTQA